MKVAIVHDWLTGMRGGERCLLAFLAIYPKADIYTLVHIPGMTSPLIDARVKGTSFLQKLPRINRLYRHLLPLYPLAISGFKLDDYDLVISTSHAAAKNVRIYNPRTRHISYCFTPMRYIWDQAPHYFGKLTPFLWPLISWLRRWDLRGAERVDAFVAISDFIAARIRCFYGRSAQVIYPPVDTSWISGNRDTQKKGEAFLYAGALVPYKKPEVVIEAFNRLSEPLWVVGKGPLISKLKEMGKSNITFLGHVPDKDLAYYYSNCRALVFPGTEDFGMIPVECMAAGRPVIGLFDGGLKETIRGVQHWRSTEGRSTEGHSSEVRSDSSGVFIENSKDSVSAVVEAVNFFVSHESEFQADACRTQAAQFGVRQFFTAWQEVLRSVKPGQTKLKTAQTNSGLRQVSCQ